MQKYKDLEEIAKAELNDELMSERKDVLKERIKEIKIARKSLAALEVQYQELLERDIDNE